MRAHKLLGRFVVVLSLVVPGLAWGQAPAAPRDATPAMSAPDTRADGNAEVKPGYRIGPEDLLDIAVWNNTSISRTTPVRPDGKISLPLLNDVQAAGLTPTQLAESISARLAEYTPNPEVSVIVREVNHFKVSVLGEVKKPGRYDFRSQATVLDALAVAGGLSDFAARSKIVVLRNNGSGGTQRIPVNYNKIVTAETPPGNLYLQPGDIILVP